MSDVKRLARWDGWCDPCEIERPLILTETGERGMRAWLRGVGAEDRALTLTCAVCGEWQRVGYDDEPAPTEPSGSPLLLAVRPVGARQVPVALAPAQPAATSRLLALRAVGTRQVLVRPTTVRRPAVSPLLALRPVGARQVHARRTPVRLRVVGPIPAPRVAVPDRTEIALALVPDGRDLIVLTG